MLVSTVYASGVVFLCRTFATAVGLAVCSQWRSPVVTFVVLPLLVSIFETHHAVESAKMRVPAGASACLLVSMVWFVYVPSAILAWIHMERSLAKAWVKGHTDMIEEREPITPLIKEHY
uniref:Uncharacterized protein n=1 Tax=Haptolina ericina TaxID=156174 RepID=A0A7S3F4P3_9EUKA|mmetsp:Transcript_48622/g.109518  ORF Transcript_48622/g.109518 Transcript_48622/m.109518 type:complete len:119 (+) Transcript_48622:848-1204(+)